MELVGRAIVQVGLKTANQAFADGVGCVIYAAIGQFAETAFTLNGLVRGFTGLRMAT